MSLKVTSRKIFLVILCVVISAGPARRSRAEDSPAVDLNAVNSPEGNVSVEIQDEPDGPYLALTSLLDILRTIDADSRAEWDNLLGVLRIKSGGKELQALSNQSIVLIDGKYRQVSKPLKVKGGGVLVPVESAKTLLAALNYDLQLDGHGAEAAGMKEKSSVAPAGTPAAGSSAAEDSSANAPLIGDSLLAPVSERALPPLDTPAGFSGKSGLNWAELADIYHRRALTRVSIVHDRRLAPLASRLKELLSQSLAVAVELIPTGEHHADASLLSGVSAANPDLVIDLMISTPASANAAAPEDSAIEVWTVHEALWPGDAAPVAPAAIPPPSPPYRVHQFQNLALGAMLRGEIARSFPNSAVRFELAPSFLLRRINAPSAALLIPPRMIGGSGEAVDAIARAVAGGVTAYSRGIQSAGKS